ncbi:MAG: hypothetical protein ACQETH_10890 [Candidatus Rifleibacteriota bacterium]
MKFKMNAWFGLALIFIIVSCIGISAQTIGSNGVAYVLLSKEFNEHGVYRLNEYENAANWLNNPFKLFNLNSMSGKVSGLSANQYKEIFLLSSSEPGDWEDADVGWLPTGMKFDDDSAIYLKVMLPDDPEGGVTGYMRSSTPHWSSASSSGSYWKINYDIDGVTYPYAVKFGGPTEVKYLDTVSGTLGTPIWPGTFSSTTGIAHPTDNRKVILPSHYAGVAYYAYGTQGHPEFPGEALDGTVGRNENIKPLKLWSEGQAGHESEDFFSCIVKRVYEHRQKSLDLYAAEDLAAPPPSLSLNLQSPDMLSSIDVRAKEFYGKYCGDNCIPGGSLGSSTIETQLSTVKVVTSTKGARYGFNPQGIRKNFSGNEINAALRVVKPNSSVTEPIAISTDDAGTNFTSAIVNGDYLEDNGITPANLRRIGVSSDFSSPNGLDYIYGSDADKFVVQDSWWGRGGIAYEYFEDTKTVRKLDYMSNVVPVAQELGTIDGDIDDIGVDGDGYLYVLRTELNPSDTEMAALDVNMLNPESSSYFFDVSDTWLRPPEIEGDDSEPTEIAEGDQQPGDYKVITLKQTVKKTVKRYPQGTGSLGAEEPRGEVFAGYDYWTRSYEVKTDNSIGWRNATWSPEADADRNSYYPAELAVVNLAKVPEALPGTSDLNIIVIPDPEPADSQAPDTNFSPETPGTSVAEHSTLHFKIEGYKPYVPNLSEYHDLKSIDDIVNPDTGVKVHENVMLNSIPGEDGSYAHDENGDGNFSGFPSSMFESSTKKTEFKWTIDWVENNEIPDNLSDLIILENMKSNESGSGEYGAFSYKFPHPGNYVVRAQVTFNKFDFSGLDASVRPHELNDSQETIDTAPFLIKVYSENLNVNDSPSYITNIQIKPTSRITNNSVPGSGVNGTGPLLSKLDFKEDKKLDNIEISFDAQFVRDANRDSNTSSALATYDGIGVWDYLYYARLYNEIGNYFPALPYTPPSAFSTNLTNESPSAHVYNYEPSGDHTNIADKIKTNVYNPGRLKGSLMEGDNGTRVDQPPSQDDWGFIQWGLYLQPTGPYGIAVRTQDLSADDRHTRGILLARGSCADSGVSKTHLGNRQYSVTIPVNADKFLEKIQTPKDPETFSLHLEIIYPRVSWLSNDLGDTTTTAEKRFSSMVPLFNDEGDLPLHVLGRMRLANGTNTEPSTNFLINQSWKDGDSGNEFFNGGKENLGVLARDYTLPTMTESPGDNPTPVIQTTGDDVDEVHITFAVYDNNPHAEMGEFRSAYEVISSDSTEKFNSSSSNLEFKKGPVITDITINDGPDNINFYANNDWKAGASFTTELTEYGPNKDFDKGKDLQNWIGTLNYTVLGSIKDGIGSYSTIVEHEFYHEKAFSDLGLSINENQKINISDSLVKAVERIDNDPPTIEVELISQVDNRRWVIKLDENINDQGPVPDEETELGKCELSAESYNLQSNTVINSYSVNTIPGCAAYPAAIGTTEVKVTDHLSDAVPQFRRASRLMVNVRITDNTGFRSLGAAEIQISNLEGGTTNLLPSNSPAIPTAPSLDMNGNEIPAFADRPRASYAIDMPMKADPSINQVEIQVRAADQDGNERTLIIPVKVVESGFDTRVLEIKENRN